MCIFTLDLINNKEAKAGYYTMIKHKGNIENTSRRCVFFTFLECSQMSGVSYRNTRQRLLHLLYDIEVMWCKQ